MLDPETLLLVDNHQPQIPELDVFRKQAMGTNSDVNLALGEIRDGSLQLFGRTKPAEHLHTHREWLETAFKGLEMLKYENCSRRQDDHLLAVPEGFERRPPHNFVLAEAHVATQQAVHGLACSPTPPTSNTCTKLSRPTA